ncbi:MAG: LacI family DNA-binding transcriptional regulator [Spirochaetes bacterium]|nr:LacI family DNA-binding transcriptional regulator [Spirochaetota bacterium]
MGLKKPSRPGGAALTQVQIARLAKVSRRSVYNFLQGRHERLSAGVRERIEGIVKTHHYATPFFIDLLRKKKNPYVAVAIGRISNEFYTQFLTGLLTGLQERGLHGVLVTGQSGADIVGMAAQQRFGAFFSTGEGISLEQADFLAERKLPLVAFEGHRLAAHGASVVGLDHPANMKTLVDFLAARKYRSLGMIGRRDAKEAGSREVCLERFSAAAGLAFRREWIIPGNDQQALAYDEVRKLVREKNRPEAIFTHNDFTAAAVLAALHDSKVAVPGEMGVIGQDGVASAAFLWPALTTLDLDFPAIIGACVERIAARHGGQAVTPNTIALAGKMVERGSTRRMEG